ncbi:MAG: DsrE family protein [Planctomycetaceae bacterium]|nr:DsrE family protein [Planctomycetaceae bacterium]
MLKTTLLILSASALASAAVMNTAPTFKTSLISQAGKYAPLPEAAHQPQAGTKMVFDITGAGEANEILKGLDRTAMFLNLAAENGPVKKDQFDIAVVFHGSATAAALNDEAYAKVTDAAANPNLPLIEELKSYGVRFYVCGQALARKNYPMEQVANDVTLATSALTVLVNEQNNGAAFVPFH